MDSHLSSIIIKVVSWALTCQLPAALAPPRAVITGDENNGIVGDAVLLQRCGEASNGVIELLEGVTVLIGCL
jgi:hypothetical protein